MAKKATTKKNSPKQMDPPPVRATNNGSAMSASVGLIVGVLVGLLLGILVLFYLTLVQVDEQDSGLESAPMNDFIERPVIISE